MSFDLIGSRRLPYEDLKFGYILNTHYCVIVRCTVHWLPTWPDE